MLSGRLFQAVGPATQKARWPILMQDDRFGTASSNARCRRRSYVDIHMFPAICRTVGVRRSRVVMEVEGSHFAK